ncbi:hypothetical protein [Nocardia cyriacigeorgica]|uniref:hypothetical protein n=1 Tax=Nocardia cyriacigeorgica TaxID=135487 RepID=UPI002457CC2E|nr:hypothetical protein [Nocardia cyriacigeorgica]
MTPSRWATCGIAAAAIAAAFAGSTAGAAPAGSTTPVVYWRDPGLSPQLGAAAVMAERPPDDPQVIVLRFRADEGDGPAKELAVHWHGMVTGAGGVAWLTSGTPLRVRVGAGPVLVTVMGRVTLIPGAGVIG